MPRLQTVSPPQPKWVLTITPGSAFRVTVMVVRADGRLHTERSILVWSMVATLGMLGDQITVPLAMDGASRAVIRIPDNQLCIVIPLTL